MRHGSLFSGIGGFDLAAQWMGWQNVFQVEKDPFCRAVLTKNFPNTNRYDDIKTFDGTKYRGTVDIVTGGFPCQPFSTAGKRKGTDDDRYLWPEMLRVIREIQPSYVVGENVRGITNWDEGVVFDSVQSDLEAEGYEVLPFLLPAAGVNAPHRRDRIWFVAHSANARAESLRRRKDEIHESGTTSNPAGIRCGGHIYQGEALQRDEQACGKIGAGDNKDGVIANTNHVNGRAGAGWQDGEEINYSRSDWQEFPTQSPVCGRNDGIPIELADYSVPSKSGTRILTGKQAYGRWRRESIKALGNSIVPQVAYQLFKAIEQWQLSKP